MKKKETIEIIDLLPQEWADSKGAVSVLMSVYQCVFFTPFQHNEPYVIGDIDGVRYVIFETELNYKVVDSVQIVGMIGGGDPHFNMVLADKTAPEGVYIAFFYPFQKDMDMEADAKIEAASGAIIASEGLNAAYKWVFNQTISLPEGKVSVASPTFVNPNFFPHPFTEMSRIKDIDSALQAIEPELRRRLDLALRWYAQSAPQLPVIDAFLKAWFALETIGMPDGTNVRPLEDVLANIYEITSDEARKKFKVGRIQGIRSNIVHKGEIPRIQGWLIDYTQAIFMDVFLHLLGLPPQKRAESALGSSHIHDDWRIS